MSAAIIGLVALAAISLGLRTTSVLLGPEVHPVGRLLLSIAAGTLIILVMLELTESYGVLELGLGLLLSLSPVGVFDLIKWWFRWRNRPGRRQLQ
jgi:hypothetical protein